MSLTTTIGSGLAALICACSAMLGAQDFAAEQVTAFALDYDVVVANQ